MAEVAWLRNGDAWRFVEALGDLPAPLWYEAGLKARENGFARGLAMRALETLAAEVGIAMSRWQLRDDIETAAWYSLPSSYRLTAVDSRPRGFQDAVEAAYVAATALLLRLRLGDRRFTVLYAPFADLVPPPRVRLLSS